MIDPYLAEKLKLNGFPQKEILQRGDLIYWGGMVEMVDGMREIDRNEIYLPTFEEIIVAISGTITIDYHPDTGWRISNNDGSVTWGFRDPTELAADLWLEIHNK